MSLAISLSEVIRLFAHFVKFKTNQKLLRTSEEIIADTIYGKVKGIKWKCLYGDRHYLSFEGIPFAKPPLGDLRFKAPVEPEPWTDVKVCKKQQDKPNQYNIATNTMNGSEDCLYLNVYTPEIKPAKAMPVLVWIYGGAFQFGDTTREIYSPDYFMMEDVVLITITYRVGAFGFLSLKDEALDVPGNAALKDQVLALKWVKNNCNFFGGDPNNITLFGESAGGASAHIMMLTQQTEGLFHKAVLMSGTVLQPWAITEDRNWAFRLAKVTGYKGENVDSDVLDHLQKAKPNKICKFSNDLLTRQERDEDRLNFSFTPCIEPYITPSCVIPKPPIEMMRDGWGNSIPLIIGGTSFEGLLAFQELRKFPYLLTDLQFEHLIPSDANLNKEQCKEFGELLGKQYFGDTKPSLENKLSYCDLCSYKYFWHGVHRTVLSRLKYAPNAPTYIYRFDFDSKFFNFCRIITCGRKYRGTCHADDLGYMFYNAASKKLKAKTPEYKTILRLTGMLIHFAESGEPNALLTSDKTTEASEPWLPVSVKDETFKCLNISHNLEIMDLPESEKLKLWDNMYIDKSLLY